MEFVEDVITVVNGMSLCGGGWRTNILLEQNRSEVKMG